MRNLTLFILIVLCSIFPLSAASVTTDGLSSGFASEENLARFDFTDSEDEEMYSDIEISLLTQSPGSQVYAWFGHTSLEVEIPGYIDRDYNWGVFGFSESFYSDFALGRLYYSLAVSRTEYSILRAQLEERELTKLPLQLTPAQKKGIVEFLNYNSQSENQQYLYHYYFDNCATRVRDIYNAATGGAFREWAEAQKTGKTFRDYTTDYLNEGSRIVSWTLNALQGPEIDRMTNLYEACFLPDVLHDAMERYENGATEVLVTAPEEIVQPQGNDLLVSSLIAGILIAVLLYTEEVRHRRLWGLLTFLITLFLSVLSLVLLFFMLFTNHDVTFFNENIAFINPLLLIPCIQGLKALFARKAKQHRATVKTYRLLLVLTLALLVLKGLFPEVFIQNNFAAMAFLLPIYTAGSIRQGAKEKKRSEKHTYSGRLIH